MDSVAQTSAKIKAFAVVPDNFPADNRCRLDSASEAYSARAPYARVPSNLLGAILDGDHHFSAYAAHLLAIKVTKGKGFALNERQVRRPPDEGGYGMGRRGFRGGIALMKRSQVLVRSQTRCRRFATEALASEGDNFVLVDEALLRNNSKLVAFILVVNLKPTPQSPIDAAARLGITSPTTARDLARKAIALGAVAHAKIAGGAVVLARKGHQFDLAKNVPAKNVSTKSVIAKNGVSHSNLEDDHNNREKPQKSENPPSHGTLPAGSDVAAEIDFLKEEQKDLGPEWIVLTDWKTTRFFREADHLPCCFGGEAPMSFNQWHEWLAYYDGAPGHLSTPAAHRQAGEIARELSAMGSFDPYDVMVALAFAICRAHASGRQIRSLGFIAQSLVGKIAVGDDTWLFDLPRRIPEADFHAAADLAEKAVKVLESYEISVSRRALLSTVEVERLSRMIHAHTHNGVVDGIDHAISNKLAVPEGRAIADWHWFDDAITPQTR